MRCRQKSHLLKFGWLGRELAVGTVRNLVIFGLALVAASKAIRSPTARARVAWASVLPLLSVIDMASAHANDSPTVDPSYWTDPPASVVALRDDPTLIRMYGEKTYSSGEPGHASRPIDFMTVRETVAWSLPAAWNLPSTGGETPLVSRRRFRFAEWETTERYALEGLSHALSTTPSERRLGPAVQAGRAFIHFNPRALPRARFVGRPVYAADERDATKLLKSLGADAPKRLVVEDPARPLLSDQEPRGSARIVAEVPERVEIAVNAETPGYLLLSDTFDPGWSATLDGRDVPIRPANVAFRSVFVPKGDHAIVFSYRPAGFRLGLGLTAVGVVLAGLCLTRPTKVEEAVGATEEPRWGRSWPIGLLLVVFVVIVASIVRVEGRGSVGIQSRWAGTFHQFTWGAKIEAIKPPPPPLS